MPRAFASAAAAIQPVTPPMRSRSGMAKSHASCARARSSPTASAGHDWAGGTRIGSCLAEFNRKWSRRLLGQNAVVLLISDGLDADAGEGLAFEAERLAKSCERLVWLNPLLRYAGFEARPAGIRALLPYVDDFLPVRNIESLEDLAVHLRDLA